MEGLQKAEISCDTKGMSVAGCVYEIRDFVIIGSKRWLEETYDCRDSVAGSDAMAFI